MTTSIEVNVLYVGGPHGPYPHQDKGYAFPGLRRPLPPDIIRSYCEHGVWHVHTYVLHSAYLHIVPKPDQAIDYWFSDCETMTEEEYQKWNEKWNRACEPWPQ